MAYSLGVDLGTTFVAAAVSDGSRAEIVALGDRSVLIPAAVYLRGDDTLLIGEHASSRTVSSPARVAREFKRRLGDPAPVILGGRPYPVAALLGDLLRNVLRKVAEKQGGPPDRVVLTHPAHWDSSLRARFEEAAGHAGLAEPLLVTEPEAAAAHYAASRQLTDGQTLAVYDLGGGTFDATVLRIVLGGVEILGIPEGVELGGVDFDEEILRQVDSKGHGALTDLDPRDPQTLIAMARLRQDCMRAKQTLSVDTKVIVPVSLPGRYFEVYLTRSDFERLVHAHIESTVAALARTLRSALVSPEDLSAVLLIGGSSRIPLVARMVSTELGRRAAVQTHPKHTVALGAATLAAQAATPRVTAALDAGHPPRAGQQPSMPRSIPVPSPAATGPTATHASPDPSTPPAPVATTAQRVVAPRLAAARMPDRRRQRRLLGASATALAVAIAAAAFMLSKPSNATTTASTDAEAVLALTTSQVKIGDSYFATAWRFAPGEPVRLSWSGPTNGVMDATPADTTGSRRHGPIVEQDPPGTYIIIATGLSSGRTASAGLQVLPP